MPRKQKLGYVAVLGLCFALAYLASLTPFGVQVDNAALDFLYTLRGTPEWRPQSVILAVDEPSLVAIGGMRHFRTAFARALETMRHAPPLVVASDVTLSDEPDPGDDEVLESAFRDTHNLVLPCDFSNSGWEEPLARFLRYAKGEGHVHAEPDRYDAVLRELPLEYITPGARRWALSLEAFRLAKGASAIVESPGDLEVGGLRIPAARANGARLLRIRYLPPFPLPGSVPRVPLKDVLENPAVASRLAGRVVFVGVTAQSAARDRMLTPFSYGAAMTGVEIHANAFETLAQGRFFRTAPDSAVFLFSLLLAAAAGLTFAWRSGWQAYAVAGGLLALAHLAPWFLFTQDIVFSWVAPAGSVWFSVAAAASYQHFFVRRQLRKSESDKARYQQAIHFVTHEMRTPLTAIQGSSELIGRYNLNDDKRKQLAQTINSESKRLARMIQTFLDVERLGDGQMELKKEPFDAREVVESCMGRARPLAERKQIRMDLATLPDATLTGDRELMEYAVYNLLTNAIKYSPPDTQVTVYGKRDDSRLWLSVTDQGIGIDEKDIKNIFRKFYRTRKAETSGEVGTGIGLSIVEQIVVRHGGRIDVTSTPGKGSCFTLVLPSN